VVENSDTSTVPFGTGAGASRGAAAGGGAVIKACNRIANKMKRIAGFILKVAPEDLQLGRGRAYLKGSPEIGISIKEIAEAAYMITLSNMPEGETVGLDALEFYDPPSSSIPVPDW
jgi:carbon-monoxide dehydrogenase large subunit